MHGIHGMARADRQTCCDMLQMLGLIRPLPVINLKSRPPQMEKIAMGKKQVIAFFRVYPL
jgi:hypothetical protein